MKPELDKIEEEVSGGWPNYSQLRDQWHSTESAALAAQKAGA